MPQIFTNKHSDRPMEYTETKMNTDQDYNGTCTNTSLTDKETARQTKTILEPALILICMTRRLSDRLGLFLEPGLILVCLTGGLPDRPGLYWNLN